MMPLRDRDLAARSRANLVTVMPVHGLRARKSREPTPNPTPRPPPPVAEERSEATGPPWVEAQPSLPEAAPPAPAVIS